MLFSCVYAGAGGYEPASFKRYKKGADKMWSVEQVAGTIDHSVLKPESTEADVIAGCEAGKKYGVASVCVMPANVKLAVETLAGSGVPVCAVIGFPFGYTFSEAKMSEAETALALGATELDMVMNVGKFLSGAEDYVHSDMSAVAAVASAGDAVLKVILETCLLDPEQIAKACLLAELAGAGFVKTSTGFSGSGATPGAVEIMVRATGGRIGVKASGGIRTLEQAISYLEQGCTRIGTAATAAILGW